MKKQQYIKPGFRIVEISLQDICVGSGYPEMCNPVQIQTIPFHEKKSKTYIIGSKDKNSIWDSKF